MVGLDLIIAHFLKFGGIWLFHGLVVKHDIWIIGCHESDSIYWAMINGIL